MRSTKLSYAPVPPYHTPPVPAEQTKNQVGGHKPFDWKDGGGKKVESREESPSADGQGNRWLPGRQKPLNRKGRKGRKGGEESEGKMKSTEQG